MSNKSMKSGDDASKDLLSTSGESSAPNAGNPQATDPNPPATVDSSAEVKALREQLAASEARHAREIDEVKRGVPTQRDVADFVREQVATAVAAALATRPASAPQEDLSKQQMEKIDRERREREESQAKDLADLEAGPMKFTISMTGEKMMTRTVGGHSPEEAKGKYEKFFGIRAITESTKQIHVAAA